ncbi:hypothetical protein EYF80_015436 [Liparis tanakae]|uniref:Uncharacterized protein n=1 Tax=Liparis tanakae TaxID=230148 RepID=A0A4Z2IB38_9TELE|nr:hypothetical protein EYF80_015436 [Liparis tanakae]
MGCVQRSAADEDSGGAVLFLLKAPVLHHQAERSIQTERGKGTLARAMWRQRASKVPPCAPLLHPTSLFCHHLSMVLNRPFHLEDMMGKLGRGEDPERKRVTFM